MDYIVGGHDELHDLALRDDQPVVDREQRWAVAIVAGTLVGLTRRIVRFLQHVAVETHPIIGQLIGPVPLVAGDLDRDVAGGGEY